MHLIQDEFSLPFFTVTFLILSTLQLLPVSSFVCFHPQKNVDKTSGHFRLPFSRSIAIYLRMFWHEKWIMLLRFQLLKMIYQLNNILETQSTQKRFNYLQNLSFLLISEDFRSFILERPHSIYFELFALEKWLISATKNKFNSN